MTCPVATRIPVLAIIAGMANIRGCLARPRVRELVAGISLDLGIDDFRTSGQARWILDQIGKKK